MKLPLPTAAVFITVAGVAAAQTIIPDPTLTSGSIRTTNLGEICFDSTRQFRHRGHDAYIFAEYGVPMSSRADYELDHLIPLELGGDDSNDNLWPEPRQSIEPVWSAERKDELENKLHWLVCDGDLDIEVAQKAMTDDWTTAYTQYFLDVGAK